MLQRTQTDMKQREKLVTFLGQVSAHMQWLRIYILHMIRMVNMRQTNWSHFWGNSCLTRSWVHGIHVAEESDRNEAEATVGHISGATFRSHAVAAYIHMAHDTYGNHWTQKLVTFLGQLLAHMQLATCNTCCRGLRQT